MRIVVFFIFFRDNESNIYLSAQQVNVCVCVFVQVSRPQFPIAIIARVFCSLPRQMLIRVHFTGRFPEAQVYLADTPSAISIDQRTITGYPTGKKLTIASHTQKNAEFHGSHKKCGRKSTDEYNSINQ